MIEKIIAVYPGRFQPMGRHHKATYDWMVQEFGVENSFIVTSNKVCLPDSPFCFDEKEKIAAAYGIPAWAIKNEKVVYAPTRYNFLKNLNPDETAVVVVVGEKDLKDSYDPKTKKIEKARFKKGVSLDGIKRNGKPTYFKTYVKGDDLLGFDVHGYVTQAPHQEVDISGTEMSGSALRRYLPLASDEEFRDAMGFDNPEVRDIIKRRLSEGLTRGEKGTKEYSIYLEELMDELQFIKSGYESRKKSGRRYRKEASKIQDAYSELRRLRNKNNKIINAQKINEAVNQNGYVANIDIKKEEEFNKDLIRDFFRKFK